MRGKMQWCVYLFACCCFIPIIIAKKLNALSLIFLTGVASAAMARAPGDGDAFCSLHSTFVKHSVSNIKVLMDSFNYFNLLPPHEGAVWQQLDLDDNNVPGEGTEVCRLDVIVMPTKLTLSIQQGIGPFNQDP